MRAADARVRSASEEDLLDAMVRQLAVLAAQRPGASTRRVKVAGKDLNAEDLAATLGVDYLATLDAEVNEERQLLSLSMVPTARDLPSHHHRFEQPTAGRLRFVEEIAKSVLADVCDLLDERVRQGMRDWGTRSLPAYRHAAAANAIWQPLDFASMGEAARHFRLALLEDPQFESVYVELADLLSSRRTLAADTTTAAETFLELQNVLAEARRRGIPAGAIERVAQTLAFQSTSTSPFEFEGAVRQRFLAGARGDQEYGDYMRLLCGAGFYDESQRYLDRALELNDGWRMEECTIAGARGDFEEYIRLLKRDLESHPRALTALTALVRTYGRLGRYREADALIEQMRQFDLDYAQVSRFWLGVLRGDLAPGGDKYERIMANPKARNYPRGLACFIAGDVERGIGFWRQIEPASANWLWRVNVQYEHLWAPGVIADPRYQALLDELGIGKRWKHYLWDRARELAPVTGIPVTSPRPPERNPRGRAASSAFELLPYGVIGLDGGGRAVFANSVAHGLLTARRGLRMLGVNLIADDSAASALLREAIARASASDGASEPTLVRCPRRSSMRALQVLVSPAHATPVLSLDRAERSARVLVIVSDPDNAPLPDAAALAQLFDLTPALARLAAAIASGVTVAEHAEGSGVRASTARQQLKELMARVGVHRQAELVRVLLSGVAQLRVTTKS